jgi:hypothetical protein
LYAPKHAPAACADYAGDKAAALWHFDREMAEASAAWHRRLGRHQCLKNPACTFLDDGDGWSFKATSEWLDRMPEQFGGNVGNQAIGHSPTPFAFRCKPNEPVVQTGPDTFRLLRLPGGRKPAIHIAAFHPGDDGFRSTIRWGTLNLPAVKGQAQTIAFPPVADLKVSDAPRALKASASSGLPVHFEVDYGPVVVRDGKLTVAELPINLRFPVECQITAYQMGRRREPAVQAAPPVSQRFSIVSTAKGGPASSGPELKRGSAGQIKP